VIPLRSTITGLHELLLLQRRIRRRDKVLESNKIELLR